MTVWDFILVLKKENESKLTTKQIETLDKIFNLLNKYMGYPYTKFRLAKGLVIDFETKSGNADYSHTVNWSLNFNSFAISLEKQIRTYDKQIGGDHYTEFEASFDYKNQRYEGDDMDMFFRELFLLARNNWPDPIELIIS